MKKKIVVGLIVLLALAAATITVSANQSVKASSKSIKFDQAKSSCTRIKDGGLHTSDNQVITTGYDSWGYNYQAHLFNGLYCNADRDAGDCNANNNDSLNMKWNDAWLSNVDCDGDGLLDRHFGYDSYIGSGAWLTNHQKGTYIGPDGQTCKYEYFVKIVAAPVNATAADGVWYNSDGIEIGSQIWGAFAITQEVNNDACGGVHGLQYLSPDHAGFGGW